MSKKAAVINGDGTGPELVDAMVRVLEACNAQCELIRCEAGSEQWERAGGGASYIPDETERIMDESDACYKGPTTTIPSPDAPRSVAVSTRQKFGLFANVRPIRTYERLSPGRSLDFVCFREATEGLYSGIEFDTSDDSAVAVRKITRKGCRRIADAAFKWAAERGIGRVVAVTKRNILRRTDGIFWGEVERASSETGIAAEEYYIDNMTQQLVKNPERFNGSVLVSTNLFMDIVSECASGSIGSIGNVYSANLGESYAMFEPAHGSAPKYRGMDKVNPTAAILSGAWMAEYLGERHVRDAVFEAVEAVVNEGRAVTYDIGGTAGTSDMASAVAGRAAALLRR